MRIFCKHAKGMCAKRGKVIAVLLLIAFEFSNNVALLVCTACPVGCQIFGKATTVKNDTCHTFRMLEELL